MFLQFMQRQKFVTKYLQMFIIIFYGINTLGLRFFTVYDLMEEKIWLITSFLNQIKKKVKKS